MALAGLILATIVDLALGALLIGVSGFIIGSGPESAHSGIWVTSGFVAMLILCVAAPIAGFVMRAHRRPLGGLLVALLPPALAVVAAVFPSPY